MDLVAVDLITFSSSAVHGPFNSSSSRSVSFVSVPVHLPQLLFLLLLVDLAVHSRDHLLHAAQSFTDAAVVFIGVCGSERKHMKRGPAPPGSRGPAGCSGTFSVLQHPLDEDGVLGDPLGDQQNALWDAESPHNAAAHRSLRGRKDAGR